MLANLLRAIWKHEYAERLRQDIIRLYKIV